jgi:hypothetical protein
MIDPVRNRVWHRQSPEQGHQTLCDHADARLSGRSQKRSNEAVKLMRLYDGETVAARSEAAGNASNTSDPSLGDEPVDIVLNIAQTLVDTLDAKVAGLENTKPQIITVEASYDVRRQARLVDRFIEGQYFERQGRFFDLWDLFRFALRLALASTGTAAVKFFADTKVGRIQCEVHDTLSMWIDSGGAVYDYPTGMGGSQQWDPERLIEVHGEKYPSGAPGLADDILKAAVPVGKGLGLEMLSDEADCRRDDIVRVPVVEGWRFKVSDRPGKYCKSFPGAKEPLCWESYDHEDPPFVFVGGQRSLTSFWHRTLTKPIVAPILRVNEILSSIDRAERLTPKGVIFYDPEEVKKEMLEVGDDHELIPVPGLSGMKGKPIYEAPAPFHPLALDLVRFYLEQCYNLPGISELHASGDTSGEWSGAALRIRKQLINERFSTLQRGYVQASTVEASKQIIRCAKQLANHCAKEGKPFAATWKGDGFMKQIDAKVLNILDEYKYDVGVYPVGEAKNTPESEIALSQELRSVGLITGDAYLNTLKHFNTMQEAKSANDAQERLIGIQIDKWLTADPSEMRGRRFYRGPVRTMDIYGGIIQVNKAYLNAQADDVDDRRLVLFSRYLKELKKFADVDAAEQASLAQAAGGGGAPQVLGTAAAAGGAAASGVGAAPAAMPAPMAA